MAGAAGAGAAVSAGAAVTGATSAGSAVASTGFADSQPVRVSKAGKVKAMSKC